MSVCVPLPGPGTYALVVLHDRDANGRLSVWSDGVGFSRNPKLGLSKPDYSRVKVTLPSGTTDIDVLLNYRQGLSVRPLKAAGCKGRDWPKSRCCPIRDRPATDTCCRR